MKFSEIVSQAVQLLQARERVTYRVLKREFALDDESLADLKEQLIDAEGVAVDKDGKMLVWAGAAAAQEPERPQRHAQPESPHGSCLLFSAREDTDGPTGRAQFDLGATDRRRGSRATPGRGRMRSPTPPPGSRGDGDTRPARC